MPYTQFHVSTEKLGHHYPVVCSDNAGGKHRFYIENAPAASKKPDLTFCEGGNNSGRVVGLARFPRFSSNCEVLIVNDECPKNEDWKTVSKRGFVTMQYSFHTPVSGEMRSLVWKKTRSMGGGSSPYPNMKLVDEQSGDVLGVFSTDHSSLVAGDLDMRVNYGESFDRWAFVTGVAVREAQRRKNNSSVRALDNRATAGAAIGGMGAGGGA
ncbi:hypothetical protein N7532_007428 [Penicillium argentinense]|uniref:Uncharacterized protein n=1 Tax=Penicillium argentinense TaxID=1131581 RepID=A0A9W9F7Y0_9EURO|nr:uncharacterized protein N7532_007428 [Penicillium argentinense]KAJ5095137.1 hypothetical protein N7532_007428 [Penicillium argentinense]